MSETNTVVPERDTILVVDDESMNLRLAKRMLDSNYEVVCAASHKEALDYLEKDLPALILLDLHMPEVNGIELLEQIRHIEKCKEIPAVFLTADCNRETEIQVFKAGALDYIQKPFVQDIVMERIKRILTMRKLQNNLEKEVEKRTSELQESRRKLEQLSLQVVQALATTVDAKDKYTNGHSERVAKYSKAIAQRLGKSIEEQNEIYFVALLHDIGKIGVPDTIINKTSHLTDEEFEAIKKHPGIGMGILKKISEMPNIQIGAHYHHERFDGKGYPEGLCGNNIPEIARIIAVADAYDAMTSCRSYRSGLSQQVVRAEIEKGKGRQFDPTFAEKMLELIDSDTNFEMRQDD
ncbi:MAG: response regulator [Fibrobacter sp.]|nr:response regulator [Fibrobacter sp.]